VFCDRFIDRRSCTHDQMVQAAACLIVRAFRTLEQNPFSRGKLIKRLKGKSADYYRIRADKYPAFYSIQDNNGVILAVLDKKNADRFIRTMD